MKKIDENIEKLCLGISSGTSVDSVDVVLLKISGSGIKTKIEVLKYKEFEYNPEFRKYILENSDKSENGVEFVCTANFLIGKFFSSCINIFLKESNLNSDDISFIASHGQTIKHLPEEIEMFGIKTKSTLQIGDISVIANLTGITTVGDFRCADVAVDGGGAPLVPYLDYILFSNPIKAILALNIGGIANITYLGKNSDIEKIIAFDTGPGNMVIDALSKKYFVKNYDYNGNIARTGKINEKLLLDLVKLDAFQLLAPPKSTGRERYGNVFINLIQKLSEENSISNPEDIIATLTEYTAFTIYNNYINLLADFGEADELIISGGGAKNKYLVERLKFYFPDTEMKILDQNGISIENKEAVLFAVLGNETLCGNTSNIRSVTGANKNVILGKICF